MEKVLDPSVMDSDLFQPEAEFLVSLHGTFTGDVHVYAVPAENFIAETDRVAADWVNLNPNDPITPADPSIVLKCGPGYLIQIRAASAGATGYWTPSIVRSSGHRS